MMEGNMKNGHSLRSIGLYGALLLILLCAMAAPFLSGQQTAPAPAGAPATTPAGSDAAGKKDDKSTDTQKQSDIADALCQGKSATDGAGLEKDKGRVFGGITLPESSGTKTPKLVFSSQNPTSRINARPIACPGDQRHFYYITDLDPSTYDATLSNGELASESRTIIVTAGKAVPFDFELDAPSFVASRALLVVPFAFLLSIWLIRWHNIAKPSRQFLLANSVDVRLRLVATGSNEFQGAIKELTDLEQSLNGWNGWEWIFWTRGTEVAGWMLVHNAEIALLKNASDERVNARLGSARAQLAEINTNESNDLAARIKTALEVSTPPNDRKQLLVEALSFLYDHGDTDFSGLTSWQNKAFWLTLVGVLLILTLSVAHNHADLFVAGAAGGFLSRLMRQIKRADVPTDYGASWATLFLSPIAGALAGWFGVLIIMLLADPSVGILSGPLRAINWNLANVAPALGTAFALGFSERLFDGIMKQLEDSVDSKQQAAEESKKAPDKNPPADALATTTAPAEPVKVSQGQSVTLSLPGIDLSKVSSVDLFQTVTRAERTATTFSVNQNQLTFTVSAQTEPGVYNVLLVTASGRVETKKQISVVDK
jgi:hypothetical protein